MSFATVRRCQQGLPMGKLSILRVRVATTLAALVILAGTGAALGIPGRSPAAIQDAATIPDTVSCAECQIEVTLLVRLGNDEPPGLVESHYTHAVRDGRGRYYVYNSDSGDELSVFNSDGKFLRVLGQPGQGPGEHQGLTVVRADDDGNILVFDRAVRTAIGTAVFAGVVVVLFPPDHFLDVFAPLLWK